MSLNQFETDEQRAEALIQWLKDNRGFLITLTLICIAVFVGTHAYQNYKEAGLVKGAETYQQAYSKIANDEALTDEELEEIYRLDQTVYPSLIASALTQQYLLDEKVADAEPLLVKAIDHERSTALKDLLRYRLAIVQYNLEKYDEALSTLAMITLQSYDSLVQTLRGDIYLKQAKADQARIAYQEALKGDQHSELTQYKLDMLGALPNITE